MTSGQSGEKIHQRTAGSSVDYRRQNRAVYDSMAAKGDPLCRPASDAELVDPLRTVDAAGWLGDSIANQDVLCLAAGGGRQSALYAAAGANITVVDLSPAMLSLDREVARQRGYDFRLIETSMEDLSVIDDDSFDLVIHPVSTCYVPDVRPVFAEVARVLRGGGVYVSQHKQPVSMQATTVRSATTTHYQLTHDYYHSGPVVNQVDASRATRRLRERGAVEYLHRWEQLLGGMARCGLFIEDLSEPLHAKSDASINSFADRAKVIPPYVRIKARRGAKVARPSLSASNPTILLPP